MDDSKGYRMSPEQILEFKQSVRPRQWADKIMQLERSEWNAAILLVPQPYRDHVKELVNTALWKRRFARRRQSDT